MEALAREANLSPSRFAHLFREQIGMTPRHYAETARLDRVSQLLERTTLSIKEITTRTGFASPFYLSTRFKQHTGVSPTRYRTLHRQGRIEFPTRGV